MAYGLRYQISYYRKSGGQTTIDILEKDHADYSPVTNLKACADPLEISSEGNINNIYEPTIGSGITIRVMATPLSLQDLFTTDPQKFMVKIYNGDSDESSGATSLRWQGFVNAGIYTESYSTPICIKSQITILCNDGMALLEDLPYTQTIGGANYTGFSTIGAVMKNIFDKLELDFLTIKTITNLEYDGHTNLFVVLSVNNENYYDEQGVAMSCRDVLKSIFSGLGLVISLHGFAIYIIDPIHLHLSDRGSKGYLTHPIYGTSESVIGIGGYLDITAKDIAWYETGQSRDIVQLFTSIDITYDPYSFIQSGYDFNEEGNASGISYGEIVNNGVTYRIHYDITMKNWVIGYPAYFEGYEEVSPDVKEVDYVIRQIVGGTGSFTYTFPLSNIQQDNGLMLELSMDIFVNTKHVSNIFDPSEAGTDISSLYLQNIQLKIGDKWYVQSGYGVGLWSDTIGYCKPYVRELDAKVYADYYVHGTWFRKRVYYAPEDSSVISDKWVTSFLYIPLSELFASGVSLVNGSVTIIIPKGKSASVVTGVQNILIKNVNIQIVDLKKKPILNDGILTNAVIDSAVNMKKAPLTIQLKNGIGPYGVSRGAFSSSEASIAGLNIAGLSRIDGDSIEYPPVKLLLQSMMGQYGSPRYKLTGKLNVKDHLTDIYFHLIKDTTYSGTKAFYIVSGTYNDREEYIDVVMIELTDTREEIS